MSERYTQTLTANCNIDGEDVKITVKMEMKCKENINLSIVKETGTVGTEHWELTDVPLNTITIGRVLKKYCLRPTTL